MKYFLMLFLSLGLNANAEVVSPAVKAKSPASPRKIAQQKKPPTTKPAQKLNSQNNLSLKVFDGDKITEFQIVKKDKGGTLLFSNSEGLQKKRDLSEKDMDYLYSEAQSLKGTNTKSLCNRQFIELSTIKKQSIGCIGSETKVAKKLTDMANLLSGIIKL